MSIAGLRPWLALCVLVVVGGCTSLSSPGNGSNDYTGWLLGHPGGDAATPAQPAANADVPAAQPVPPANVPAAQPVPPANMPMAQPAPAGNVPMAQPAPAGNVPVSQPVPPAGGEIGPMIPGPAAQPNWHGSIGRLRLGRHSRSEPNSPAVRHRRLPPTFRPRPAA